MTRSHRIVFAAVLVIAAAYRFPGVSWGFDFSTAPFSTAHPDEGIACLEATERGVSELKNGGNPMERGMMFQCALLGFVFEPLSGIVPRARIGRTYPCLGGDLVLLTG